jgi:pseudouridine-5'-monophosphatase
MAKSIQGAIFDLDGTLLDTEPLYYDAYSKAAESLGHDYSFDVHRHLLGRAEHEGASNFLRILGIPDMTPEQLLALRDRFLLDLMPHVTPLPGAVSVVQSMAAMMPTAIATSSLRAYLPLKSQNNPHLFDHVDAVICGDDDGVRGKSKPDPAIFLAAAKAIGAQPEACIAFEDSLAGIRSAKAAGMNT